MRFLILILALTFSVARADPSANMQAALARWDELLSNSSKPLACGTPELFASNTTWLDAVIQLSSTLESRSWEIIDEDVGRFKDDALGIVTVIDPAPDKKRHVALALIFDAPDGKHVILTVRYCLLPR